MVAAEYQLESSFYLPIKVLLNIDETRYQSDAFCGGQKLWYGV
jgi:hypothetical protein